MEALIAVFSPRAARVNVLSPSRRVNVRRRFQHITYLSLAVIRFSQA